MDGVEREYSQIDPEDIESFSVLKDASATAVFGVRGANGVILITTKRGETSKPVVDFRTSFTMNTPIRLPEKLGSYDYARLKNEALMNVGKYPNTMLMILKCTVQGLVLILILIMTILEIC